jgi:hypothetical protein
MLEINRSLTLMQIYIDKSGINVTACITFTWKVDFYLVIA